MPKKDDTIAPEKLHESIEELDESVEQLDDSIESLIKSMGYWPSLYRGILSALGAAIGATLVIGLIIYVLQALAGFPFIGALVEKLLEQLQRGK